MTEEQVVKQTSVLLVGMLLSITAWATQPLAGDDALVFDEVFDEASTNTSVTCPLAQPLRVGAYNWPASQVMRAVMARLLELAYGCSVEVLEGLPYALEMALVRGELDVLVGVSSTTASTPVRDALAAGDVASMSVLYQQQAGFFVSEALFASLNDGQISDLAQRLAARAPVAATPQATDTVDGAVNDAVDNAVTASTPAETPVTSTQETPGATIETTTSDVAVTDETNDTASSNVPATTTEADATAADTAADTEADTVVAEDTEATPDVSSDATAAMDASDTNATNADTNIETSLPDMFVNCPVSWQCHDINLTKLAAYGLDITVATPDNAAAVVASLQAAQAEGRPWLGFLWTPSWLPPTFALERLSEPAYSDTCWQADRMCAYPADDVLALWRTDVSGQLPEDMRVFLEQVQFASVLSELLAFQQQAINAADVPTETIDATVTYFLRNYPDLWQGWLEPEVVARVNRLIRADTSDAAPTPEDNSDNNDADPANEEAVDDSDTAD
jgi:ABC-type proline/glycine betaine transport system substrate-binding protein